MKLPKRLGEVLDLPDNEALPRFSPKSNAGLLTVKMMTEV